ncbi:MAG: glycosyl transferase family protein [uncultured bacterium]|uniref:Glycosyl transferase, family 11 n=1 Tax=Candidatus Wolfebacteria bacterium GW2011_GWC2_39_22 TaxID=1619013 RepID=A0A0G0NAY5_9BACT|nr:MAG: glycosyl transferase family protein [uncultured bacterium]KKR12603.1 MAG: Glycosyl transferase, family 11 [Candidatus Wolfebacteria bacterium GW2011_GWC2_39_22]HBI25804.1 alpha-1,2-fucosyltransferase [Candidatus Wolfebacteria bacterium]
MIIVKLKGGMGNQMFQYAIGRNLATKLGTQLRLDLTFLLDRSPRKDFVFRDYDLDIFALDVAFAGPTDLKPFTQFRISHLTKIYNIFPRLLGRPYVISEPHFHFSEAILKSSDNVYLDGYWQSEKYFKEIENSIRDDFKFRQPLEGRAAEMAAQIKNEDRAVCLNVRRADFVTSKKAQEFHGFIGLDYYQKAVDLLVSKVGPLHLFIFSDDVDWCAANLKFNYPTTFVTKDYSGKKYEAYLQLMTLCRHYIIPNSTFAWWGAWLNSDPNKIVIAPKQWFKEASIDTTDIIPSTWIRL